MDKKLQKNFDVSMSFGLAEHFTGEKRIKIIKTHFDVLKKEGITFISVPNKFNPPYQINKTLFQLFGFWKVGEEHPFSPKELINLSNSLGKKSFTFGGSFISSLNFVNPIKLIQKIFHLQLKIKKQRKTIFDNSFSYEIILVGQNN